MNRKRDIRSLLRSRPTVEGAGVRLKRAFGNREVPLFDPFLLLDDFHSDSAEDYQAGFPWHPHRGIETVTYMLQGKMEHQDSMGNRGVMESGDVQWMTAGSGIIHSEMPRQNRGPLWGFQLWVNLPASSKMMDPRYRDIMGETIPEVELDGGVRVRVISGRVGDVEGPVRDIVVAPEYLDVSVPPNGRFVHGMEEGRTAFAYVIEGGDGKGDLRPEHLALFGDGDGLELKAGDRGLRFLLVSGKPIGEPVAWYGPIVMNTQEELEHAFNEYRVGSFVKARTRTSWSGVDPG
jgi:redox-sensitive bicupin YhaK (pirin superfamily)